jgi:hypothetical protein
MTHLRIFNSCKTRINYLATSAITLLLLSYAPTILAQTGSVNFSGTWSFNESKSSPAEGGFRMGAGTLVVTQEGINLTVDRTSRGPDGNDMKTTSKFTLDGKACVNTVFGNNTRSSNVTWSADGKILNFAHTMKFEMDGQSNEFKSSEALRINDSDKTLVIETVFNGPNGEMKATNVYDKK